RHRRGAPRGERGRRGATHGGRRGGVGPFHVLFVAHQLVVEPVGGSANGRQPGRARLVVAGTGDVVHSDVGSVPPPLVQAQRGVVDRAGAQAPAEDGDERA